MGNVPERSPSVLQAVRILCVPAQEGVCCLFCGPIVGLLTHWHQGRSWGCPGEAKCPLTMHRSRTVWKGYAPVRSWNPKLQHWSAAVLEVTECLEELLRGRELGGEVWMLSREAGRKKSGQLQGLFLEQHADRSLCKEFDVKAPLFRLYHTTELELGVRNPIPPKLVLPAAIGAAPSLPQVEAAAATAPPTKEQMELLRKFAARGQGTPAGSNGRR